MSLVSNCPKCRQQVSIPDQLDPQSEVRCPLCAREYPLSEAIAEAPPALIPIDTRTAHVEEASTPEIWQKIEDAPQIDTGDGDSTRETTDSDQTSLEAEALAAVALGEPEHSYEPVDASPLTHRRRRRKEKSAVRFLAEVFLGGFLGLLIGYYALCWIWGTAHGLPKLPLPLLPHTMHWWTDSATPDGAQATRPSSTFDIPVAQLPIQEPE